MSELQNDFVESEIIDQPEVENQDIGVDLAPTSEAEHEEQPQAVDEEQQKQEAINKAINKKHFEAQQAKRELEAANARIQEFEEKQREQMAAQVGNIPPMPDAFDDDYDGDVNVSSSSGGTSVNASVAGSVAVWAFVPGSTYVSSWE